MAVDGDNPPAVDEVGHHRVAHSQTSAQRIRRRGSHLFGGHLRHGEGELLGEHWSGPLELPLHSEPVAGQ